MEKSISLSQRKHRAKQKINLFFKISFFHFLIKDKNAALHEFLLHSSFNCQQISPIPLSKKLCSLTINFSLSVRREKKRLTFLQMNLSISQIEISTNSSNFLDFGGFLMIDNGVSSRKSFYEKKVMEKFSFLVKEEKIQFLIDVLELESLKVISQMALIFFFSSFS